MKFGNLNSISRIFIILFLFSCVEPIEFIVPSAESQLIVEGMISSEPGPYMVKLTKAMKITNEVQRPMAVEEATITLYDGDSGVSEIFTEMSPGIYLTSGLIRGEIGHSYYITIETKDGKSFISDQECINPVGSIDQITYEFESRTSTSFYGLQPANVFNIYINATNATESPEPYVRWRLTGTYEAFTYPELYEVISTSYTPYKDPFPCSGYIVVAFSPGGKLEKVAECTCCTCYGSTYESIPQISDGKLVSENQYRHVKVGEIPITNATFYNKYKIEVEQMSLSENSYRFFDLVKKQKEGSSNLFQPPPGVIVGNIHSLTNNDESVLGLFWTTSINKRSLFIDRSEVPYKLPPIDIAKRPCADVYPNATYKKPEEWD